MPVSCDPWFLLNFGRWTWKIWWSKFERVTHLFDKRRVVFLITFWFLTKLLIYFFIVFKGQFKSIYIFEKRGVVVVVTESNIREGRRWRLSWTFLSRPILCCHVQSSRERWHYVILWGFLTNRRWRNRRHCYECSLSLFIAFWLWLFKLILNPQIPSHMMVEVVALLLWTGLEIPWTRQSLVWR